MATASPPVTAVPLASPLKQVNDSTVKPRALFHSLWAELTSDRALLTTKSPQQVTRYFQDLFCLTVNEPVLSSALEGVSTAELVKVYKTNVTGFFTNAVKVLKETDRRDIRRANVVETLIPFLRNLLSRTYDKFSYTILVLLAGSLERADAVFTDLVAAIDLTLQDTSSTLELRHRTLQLALVLVGGVNQGSLTAYFLRRDLFSTLVRFMADASTAAFAYESVLLLGLLANFRKNEARNPYLVRIEDLVDDTVMSNVVDVVEQVCTQARDAYTAIVDDSPASFVASLTSLMFSLRLSELITGFRGSLTLPPPVSNVSSPKLPSTDSPHLGTTGSPKAKGKEREDPLLNVSTSSRGPSPLAENGKASPGSGAVTPSTAAATKAREESAFKSVPPATVAILLPFYDLLSSNSAFASLVFTPIDNGPAPLPPALISLTSYIFCHAAVSPRARAYARLGLVLLVLLLEEGGEKLTGEPQPIRLCRQRLPMLPLEEKKVPIAAILDAGVIFLQHNLHKKLDTASYILALKLLQRAMQQLKAERVHLHYDWVRVWRAVLTLAGFLLSKAEDITASGADPFAVRELEEQVFVCLSYAAYWGDAFFDHPEEGAPPGRGSAGRLMYELVHAEKVLNALAFKLGHSIPKTTSTDASEGGVAVCIANVLTIIGHFSEATDQLRKRTAPEEPDAEQVMEAFEEALPGLELVESSAAGDLRRWKEWEGDRGEWEEGLVGVVAGDAVGLVAEGQS